VALQNVEVLIASDILSDKLDMIYETFNPSCHVLKLSQSFNLKPFKYSSCNIIGDQSVALSSFASSEHLT